MFGRPSFYKLNKSMYSLALRGMGVLNYQNPHISGEAEFLSSYLKGGNGILIDVGANRGDYTKLALECNSNLDVYAFEPHPITFKNLSKFLGVHKNVTLINKGVSDKPGRLKIYDYADNDGSTHASIFEGVIKDIHRASRVSAHEVEVTSLDNFAEEYGINSIFLLKIDTEGNELNVLKGAGRLLEKKAIKAIHFEFNEMNIVSRVFFKDILSLLRGYRAYRLLPHGMVELEPYSPLSCEIFAYQNIVAFCEK